MQLKQEYLTLQKASMSSLKKAMTKENTVTVGTMKRDVCMADDSATRNGKCKYNCEFLVFIFKDKSLWFKRMRNMNLILKLYYKIVLF